MKNKIFTAEQVYNIVASDALKFFECKLTHPIIAVRQFPLSVCFKNTVILHFAYGMLCLFFFLNQIIKNFSNRINLCFFLFFFFKNKDEVRQIQSNYFFYSILTFVSNLLVRNVMNSLIAS